MSDVRTINAELMFLNWSDTATSGGKIVFAVGPDDLEQFKHLTRKEGKRPGQRFMAAFALVDEQEQPERIGPICTLAVMWCREPAFHEFLGESFPDVCAFVKKTNSHATAEDAAAEVLRSVLGVSSRRDLDTDPAAARRFTNLVRGPYRAYLAAP